MKENIIKTIQQQTDELTTERRKIAALSSLALIDFSAISLYQLGYIKSLPDLPGKIFDSNKVNASKDAVLLGLPDGVLSMGMYSLNLILAAAGAKNGKKRSFYDYLLAGVVMGQAGGAAHYLYNMAFVQKKICPYCVVGAAINFISLGPLIKLFKKS